MNPPLTIKTEYPYASEISKLVAQAPPLSQERRERVAMLLGVNLAEATDD